MLTITIEGEWCYSSLVVLAITIEDEWCFSCVVDKTGRKTKPLISKDDYLRSKTKQLCRIEFWKYLKFLTKHYKLERKYFWK